MSTSRRFALITVAVLKDAAGSPAAGSSGADHDARSIEAFRAKVERAGACGRLWPYAAGIAGKASPSIKPTGRMYSLLARIALPTALLFALVHPLRADAQTSGCENLATVHQPTPSETCPDVPPIPRSDDPAGVDLPGADDISAGLGPDDQAKALRRIAVYASIGNREGVEILIGQLRALGVSKEKIEDAVMWTKLHTTPFTRPAPSGGMRESEATQ